MSHTLTIVPDFFYQIYLYREYLKQSVLRDLRTKYKRSILGYLWTMIHPLAMMAVLATVFSHIMRIPIEHYAVFLFSGLLVWNYFSSTVMMSLGSIRANAKLFGQLPVPKYLIILSISFSNLVNLILAIIPLLIIMAVLGHPIQSTIVLFPLVLLPVFAVTIGMSLMLSAAAVFFDDTNHLVEVALSALYFLSPVLYHRGLLPQNLVEYLTVNPLFYQVEFFRGLFYDGTLPAVAPFLTNALGSFVLLLLGLLIFRKVEDKFLYFI